MEGAFGMLLAFAILSTAFAASPGQTAIDLDHDGKADLFWYNVNNGQTSAWLMNGSQVSKNPTYSTVPASSGRTLLGYGDFNGDGKTDLFWYNPLTGETSAWLMNGDQISKSPTYAPVSSSSGWTLKGFGDFDGDGKTDLFWYNRKTGATSVWIMNGDQTPQYTAGTTVSPSSGWAFQGVGDFNGDGKADLFWYNPITGETSAWLMNGGQSPQYISYANVPYSSGWILQGFGDFNGDQKTDIFWYNPDSGAKSAWLMDGIRVLKTVSYGSGSWANKGAWTSGWVLQGFGDFNGDGRTDLLWYNRSSGDTAAWLMSGDTYTLAVYNNVPVSSQWSIESFGDFNGDGKTDLFWYKRDTGETSAWLMNGGKVPQIVTYAQVPLSSGWVLGGPYSIRVHAIPLSDGEIGSYGRACTATSSQMKTLVDAASTAYAPAGLRFEFDETVDWQPMQDTTLNSLDNNDPNYWKYPNQVAARYPGEIVVFLRWGSGSAPAGNAFAFPPDTGAPVPPSVTLPTLNVNFVAFRNPSALMDPPTFVHELGHFLGLYHTFPGWRDDLINTPTTAGALIKAAGGMASGLDGDLLSDTPAEAGTQYYEINVNSYACSSINSYVISGITFTPDRQNVMGYFGGRGCQPPYHVSTQQVRQIRMTLQHPTRRGLILNP
jgi:hypothetical protein